MGKDLLEIIAKCAMLLNRYGYPVLCVACIVMGILILIRKDNITKILGIWLVTSGVGSVFSLILQAVNSATDGEASSWLSGIDNAVAAVVSFAVIITFYLYAKYSYGVRGLVALIIIKLSAIPANILFAAISNAVSDNGFETGYRMSCFRFAFILLFDIAVYVIIFLAHFKNRGKESHLPKMYLVPLLSIISKFINIICNVIFAFAGTGNGGLRDGVTLVMLIIADLFMFVVPAAGIYILRKGRKSIDG